jgi:hypothetical protein
MGLGVNIWQRGVLFPVPLGELGCAAVIQFGGTVPPGWWLAIGVQLGKGDG